MSGRPIQKTHHGLCNAAVPLGDKIPSRDDKVVVVFPDKRRRGNGILSTEEYSTHVIPVNPNDGIYDFEWHDAKDIEFSPQVMFQLEAMHDCTRIVIVSR